MTTAGPAGDLWTAPIGVSWISALHVLLAVAVTVHVLLSKRDVAAAIGWIGLAWLSPFVGSALYFTLGINRVRRLARVIRPKFPGDGEGAAEHPLDLGHLAPLQRAVARLTSRPARPGNRIVALVDGDQAYPRMLEAITAARESVVLSTYILRADAAGAPFIEALVAACRRGLSVRVLVDGIGSGYFFSPAFARLRRGGVPVAQFLHSPLPWRMPFLNLRSHKKILVVDGRIGFTGGLNIAAENLLATDAVTTVRDTHFRIEGPVVTQFLDDFEADWAFVTGGSGRGPKAPALATDDGSAVARAVISGPDEDVEKIVLVILEAIASADASIRIATPYFLPDERLITALQLAALRGVAVELVIPGRSNRRLVDWATRAHVEPLLEAGCRIWESALRFDHSKLMTVDETWSLVGSSNWDVRSFRLNFELDLEVYDPVLARGLDSQMAARRGRELVLSDLRRRPLDVRLRDAAARLLLPYL
jgi:cardiolipin synthase